MSIIVPILESLCVLAIYNTLVNNNVVKNLKEYLLISIALGIIVTPILESNFNGAILVLIMIFIFTIFVSSIDKREKINVFFEMCVSHLILLVLQFISSTIIYMFVGSNVYSYIIFIPVMIILFILILFLGRLTKALRINLEEIINKQPQINILVVNIILVVFLVKLFIMNFVIEMNIMLQIVVILSLLIIINSLYFISIVRRNRKSKKEEIEKNIDPLIDDLINKMRAREHEYKNHLNMLYCMVQVCNESELKEKVKDYVGSITSNEDELSKIARIDNTIIKAILFSKVKLAEGYEVQFKYNIESSLENISLDNSELTVLLANLLNNAIESSGLCKEKYVELDIYEEDDEYIIYVKNSIEDLEKEAIKRMFKEGYSTKGINRGYGLFNIKSILDKHKGNIYFNIKDDYIEFNIELPIEKCK
ncbi:Sensor protein CitS [uncultured Clostridium sp.]|uniref:sensor histidine kinase n=1 Tax=uncultured Clostridium sp. TaxID=59620 RepID=UPI000822238E|nr:GHKL domain-containing protein [uncultured Clostridium sp.]SCJ59755.1 Sensor protein CitS [uncultured Clostridium sp.]